jgi:hypothetical protein
VCILLTNKDKHVSIVHEVWKLFSDISLNLDKYYLDYLFSNKILTIPNSNYDYKFIDFVQSITEKVVEYSQNNRMLSSSYIFNTVLFTIII